MKKQNIFLEGKTILVTGAAGFIGSNLVVALLDACSNCTLVGLDNMNDYYDIALKEYRLNKIVQKASKIPNKWIFIRADISDKEKMKDIFDEYHFEIVINLAAQAGVRYSITNPDSYIMSNIVGFYNILEMCRNQHIDHLIFASSSSVYGANEKIPYSTDDMTDSPVSLYAATKKADELLAHAYSKLYNIPSTGLRFFTVYGPAGRPDMAYFGFTKKLINGEKIQLFNYGNCLRDFTYIDDIVEGIMRVIKCAPTKVAGDDGLPVPPFSIYNIGNSQPESLTDFVKILGEELKNFGVLPKNFDLNKSIELVPMQAGDVPITYADTTGLEKDFNYKPQTSLRNGLKKFTEWYFEYYIKDGKR